MNANRTTSDRIRVAEYVDAQPGIASAYAGWLLAQLGADVTRMSHGAEPGDGVFDPERTTASVLAHGKHNASCPDNAQAFVDAVADHDILLLGSHTQLANMDLTPASLQTALPGLVIGIASVFGTDGPLADAPATGLDAQALSAVAWSLGEAQRKPLSLPPGIVEHQAGAMLACGALLALQVRDDCGSGRVVDIALADVLASYVAGNCRFFIHHGLRWHRSGRRASGSGGAYPFVILPCKDGEVCVFGRTPQEWARLVKVMGEPDWASEPRYQDLRAMGQRYPEESDALIQPWLAQHTKAELEAIALEHNLILSPLRNFDEVLASPQFAERGFFQEQAVQGQTVMLPGLPFRVSESRTPSAPNIANTLLQGRRAPAPLEKTPAQPLSGVRVLDFGWVWSAPWVSAMLGELGAQVIKVEHASRPDNLRLAGRVIRDGKKVEGPSKEMSPMFHQVNHGKLGITLNVKKPEAAALAKRLAAISDVVIENMSPGAMERSGLGFDVMRAANPRIVMLSMSAAGQFGPLAQMRAYAPNMSSAAGMEALVGYCGEAPIGALNFALGDPNASIHALLAVLASLRRAQTTGEASYIDLSQIEALVGVLRPYVIESQFEGRQTPTSGNRHPSMAPHGIFPAAGEDAWLSIAVPDEAAWRALQAIGGRAQWASDPRYTTMASRLAHIDALEADFCAWTQTQPRDALVARLRNSGIASSPVLSVEEQWHHEHFQARGVKHKVTIAHYGDEDIFQAPWRFSDFAPQVTRCGPGTGEHNQQVLGGLLGLSRAAIDELIEAGVVA